MTCTAAAVPSSRVVDLITALFLAGPVVRHDDANWHRARIRWEWNSGQWVMEAEGDKLLGWMSYYRVSKEILDRLRPMDLSGIESFGRADQDLTTGPHLYFATALVLPWAPAGTFVRLARLIRGHNPDADTVSWHHRKKDGTARFIHLPAQPNI